MDGPIRGLTGEGPAWLTRMRKGWQPGRYRLPGISYHEVVCGAAGMPQF